MNVGKERGMVEILALLGDTREKQLKKIKVVSKE